MVNRDDLFFVALVKALDLIQSCIQSIQFCVKNSNEDSQNASALEIQDVLVSLAIKGQGSCGGPYIA